MGQRMKGFVGLVVLWLLASAVWGVEGIPTTVSPGGADGFSVIGTRCPTFSWGGVAEAESYELVVFEVNREFLEGERSEGEVDEGRYRVRLPGVAVSWTPAMDRCLERGGRYAWFVRALGEEWSDWSEAKVFEVASGPSIAEVEEALRVLRRYTEGRQPTEGEALAEPGRPREPLARGRGLVESEKSEGPRPDSRAADKTRKGVRPGEEMRDDLGRRLAETIQMEPEWFPSLESPAAEAAAPTLGAASLTLDGDLSLADTSSMFKDGDVFLWDDDAGNLSLGRRALHFNTTGWRNTAVGRDALFVNTSGSKNTASGWNALGRNTTGFDNTAVGLSALFANTTGSRNTACGSGALLLNTTGNSNTASGFYALRFNTTADGNTAIGDYALFANTEGSGNTAVGANALASNTTGYFNTAVGSDALLMNSEGEVFPGVPAAHNTAVGHHALRSNTGGRWNTAVGSSALSNNTEGFDNTAVGNFALWLGTTGSRNTALGNGALYATTTGSQNTALGHYALFSNSDGARNTAVGYDALHVNSAGDRNTALGNSALWLNSEGSRNVALGNRAGFNSTTGDDNIFISNEGASTDNAVIKIGTQGTQSKTLVAGIRGTTTDVADAIPVVIDSNGQLGTVSSSRRFKEDIRDMAAASDRLLELRPVTFRYRRHGGSDEGRLQYGLIAEEVAKIFPELVVSSPDGQPETVLYHLMTAMLLNELRKQYERVEVQESLLADQRRELERLRARVGRLEGAEAGLGLDRTNGYTVPPRPPDSSGR